MLEPGLPASYVTDSPPPTVMAYRYTIECTTDRGSKIPVTEIFIPAVEVGFNLGDNPRESTLYVFHTTKKVRMDDLKDAPTEIQLPISFVQQLESYLKLKNKLKEKAQTHLAK